VGGYLAIEVLRNAITGKVGSDPKHLSGNATYRELASATKLNENKRIFDSMK